MSGPPGNEPSSAWETGVCDRSTPQPLPPFFRRRDFGATETPRKPNYDFERREREKSKAADSARKAQAKADRKGSEQVAPIEADPSDT